MTGRRLVGEVLLSRTDTGAKATDARRLSGGHRCFSLQHLNDPLDRWQLEPAFCQIMRSVRLSLPT